MNTQKGIAPIIIIALVILASGGVLAVVQRDVLKSYFEKGEKPTESQRTTLTNEFKDGDIPEEQDFADSDKPTANQFHDLIDSSLNMQDDGLTTYKTAPVVLTEDKKEFSLDETSGPVTFRWTPVEPQQKKATTYLLKVWQLMQGQSGVEAMKTNKPIVAMNVENVTEATLSNIYNGPCKPPYLCDYVWAIETVSQGGDVSAGSVGAPATLQTSETSISGSDGGTMPVEPLSR